MGVTIKLVIVPTVVTKRETPYDRRIIFPCASMYMYEFRLQDFGKNEYPWFTSDCVDEIDEIAISRKGVNDIAAKMARSIDEARTNNLSSLEKGSTSSFTASEQSIFGIDLFDQEIRT